MFYFAVLNLECRASQARQALCCWSAYYTLLAFWTIFPITSLTAVVELLRESLWSQEQLCEESSTSQFTAPISRVTKYIWFSTRGHHRAELPLPFVASFSSSLSVSWDQYYLQGSIHSSREHPIPPPPFSFLQFSSQWLSHWLEPQSNAKQSSPIDQQRINRSVGWGWQCEISCA